VSPVASDIAESTNMIMAAPRIVPPKFVFIIAYPTRLKQSHLSRRTF